jgi:hypothetical protein
MAFLPPNPLDLHGGCFCGAIRYTINVPALEDRPLVPNMLKTPIGSDKMVDTRWPTIELDHCDSCRHAAGAIIQCWLICPAPWISWSLLKRSSNVGPAQSPLPASRNEQSEGREAFSAVDVSHPTGSKKQEALADTYLSSFSTSNTVHRAFCGRCGTNLTYYYEQEPSDERVPRIDITVGSLDTSSLTATGVRPDRHGWWSDGVEWVQKLLFAGDTTLIRHPEGNIGVKV